MIESLFPYILPIHVATVFILVGLVLWTDHIGLNWICGKAEILNKKDLKELHRFIWYGLGVMIITGVLLAYPFKDYLFSFTPFLVKMGFVSALLINGVVIGKLMHVATERSFESLAGKEKLPLFLSGAVSTISWIGAITAATLLNL